MPRAMKAAMAIQRYQDLIVWQAGDALRAEVYRLTEGEPTIRDFRFRDQLRAAAGSVTANVVEGYRRFSPRDFARFLDVAYASAGEVANWLDDGIARRYWTDDDLVMARRQLRRLDGGLKSLTRYLRTQRAADHAKDVRRALSAEDEPSER